MCAQMGGKDGARQAAEAALVHTRPHLPASALAFLQVRTQVLDLIAADPGLQQAELVLLGLFGRACQALEGGWGGGRGGGPAVHARASARCAAERRLVGVRSHDHGLFTMTEWWKAM